MSRAREADKARQNIQTALNSVYSPFIKGEQKEFTNEKEALLNKAIEAALLTSHNGELITFLTAARDLVALRDNKAIQEAIPNFVGLYIITKAKKESNIESPMRDLIVAEAKLVNDENLDATLNRFFLALEPAVRAVKGLLNNFIGPDVTTNINTFLNMPGEDVTKFINTKTQFDELYVSLSDQNQKLIDLGKALGGAALKKTLDNPKPIVITPEIDERFKDFKNYVDIVNQMLQFKQELIRQLDTRRIEAKSNNLNEIIIPKAQRTLGITKLDPLLDLAKKFNALNKQYNETLGNAFEDLNSNKNILTPKQVTALNKSLNGLQTELSKLLNGLQTELSKLQNEAKSASRTSTGTAHNFTLWAGTETAPSSTRAAADGDTPTSPRSKSK